MAEEELKATGWDTGAIILEARALHAKLFFRPGVRWQSMNLISLHRPAMVAVALAIVSGCSMTKPQQPPSAWRNVNGGMTQQEINQLLGPPSRAASQGTDLWIKAGWELQVDYDQYGRARNILSRPVGK